MGSYFSVKPKDLNNKGSEVSGYAKILDSADSTAAEAQRILLGMKGNIRLVSVKLNNIRKDISLLSSQTRNMGAALIEISSLYENTDNIIADSNEDVGAVKGDKYIADDSFWSKVREFFGWGTAVKEEEIESVVFDESGDYGGDQAGPASKGLFGRGDIYDIVREHFPDITDKEIATLLKRINSEGCGYVAIINTIFAAYEGREKEFEKDFGFPMYKNGDLNYDELLVDFYCETDNHNALKGQDTIDYTEDYNSESDGSIDDYDYRKDSTGNGTNAYSQEYRTKRYLESKGVQVEIKCGENVTIENFREYSENGYVVINYIDGPLQNLDGDTVQDILGHSMTITGTTSDGRYIVSSWGNKYYIDPNQGRYNFVYYQYR